METTKNPQMWPRLKVPNSEYSNMPDGNPRNFFMTNFDPEFDFSISHFMSHLSMVYSLQGVFLFDKLSLGNGRVLEFEFQRIYPC